MGAASARADSLLDAFVAMLMAANNVIGVVVLGFILLQVVLVLCALYIRPPHTFRQWVKLLLICFAAAVLCCMTIGLLWKLTV